MAEISIPIKVIDIEKLDEAIAKANKLVELLKESNELINTLSGNSYKAGDGKMQCKADKEPSAK